MSRCLKTASLLLFGLYLSVTTLPAQTPGSSTPDSAGVTFAKPVSTGVLGVVDEAALNELRAHMAAVSPDGWVSFRGTGKITYGSDSASFDAMLSASNSSRYRLDAGSKQGSTSIRIDRTIGKIQQADGTMSEIPLEAALAGVFPFELARTFRNDNHAVSLRDGGPVSVAGLTLHKVTLECMSLGLHPISRLPNTTAVDLYFDPSTHLLVKTVATIPVAGSRNLKLLSAVTYSDYRQVGSSLMPFHLSESVEGELSRTLQLSDVQLAPALDKKFFTF